MFETLGRLQNLIMKFSTILTVQWMQKLLEILCNSSNEIVFCLFGPFFRHICQNNGNNKISSQQLALECQSGHLQPRKPINQLLLMLTVVTRSKIDMAMMVWVSL